MLVDETMQKLHQYVFDENKIVTCKNLRKDLKLEVDLAKKYMTDFLKDKNDGSVNVNYFLAGLQEIDGVKLMKVLIVPEETLEKEKLTFSEITSCHVYSLSKVKIEDCSLYKVFPKNIDDDHKYMKYSPIRHPNLQIQPKILNKKGSSKTSLNSLAESEKPISQDVTKQDSKKVEMDNNNSSQSVSNTECYTAVNDRSELNGETPIKFTSSAPKKEAKLSKNNPLTTLWKKKESNAQNSASDISKHNVKGKDKPDTSKKVPKNNIMAMFSKQKEKHTSSELKLVSNHDIDNKKAKVCPAEIIKDAPKHLEKKHSSWNEKPLKTYSNKRKSVDRQSRKKQKNTSDDESDSEHLSRKKKHRRICTFDSDSDSENEEDQDKLQRQSLASENPLEVAEAADVQVTSSDDGEDPIPPTPPVLNGKTRKKVWKTVQKTFEDEDGFFVTKQEKELVSDDDEDPLPNKNNCKNSPEPKLFTNRKQASLTTFFKQK